MERIWIFAVMTVVVLYCSVGCGQQGAGDSSSAPTGKTTAPGEQATTTEETTVLGGLQCPTGQWVSGVTDYVMGAKGEKGNPVAIARRQFSKEDAVPKIQEDDTVELAESPRGRNATATVRVIRDSRVVALIEYRRSGGGWLQDHYEACSDA